MNQLQMFKAGVLLAVSIVLTGCATSRSEIKLSEPSSAAATKAAVASKNKTVLLREVFDERVFEDAPSSPSTPSPGFEGSAKSTAEIKARAIGRKRNGFGKALGDVLLENGMTVSQVMRKNITTSLQEDGFKVANRAAAAGEAHIVIDAHVSVHAADHEPSCRGLHFLRHGGVVIPVRLLLSGGPREGMGRGGDGGEPIASGHFDNDGPQAGEIGTYLAHRTADARGHLDL